MQKRFLASVLAAVMSAAVVLGTVLPVRAKALLFTPNATVQSDAAVLMNLDIGQIVYEKNADMRKMSGALVQIMTAVIVLENCPDIASEKITAKEDMYQVFEEDEYPEDLRYAHIEAGDQLTAEDLLYAMLLTSSVEAAYMLTDHFGKGDQDAFAEMMNSKAEELGMSNTRFTNGTGLYNARQLTTARDMMTLLNYAMSLPKFDTIACTNEYTPPTAESAGKAEDWTWKHSNLMVDESSDNFCKGVRGIKTANSQEGHRCIACKGSRDGNNYLVVCLDAPLKDMDGNNRFYHLEDAKNILEWAFRDLSFQDILSPNKQLGQIHVNNAEGNDVVILVPAQGYSCIWSNTTDKKSVQEIAEWPSEVDAPVRAGDKLGKVTLKLAGETLAEIDVVAEGSVDRSFWRYNLSEIPGFFRSKYLRRTVVLAIVLSVIYIVACVYFAFRYHEERKKREAARAGHLRNRNQL